jgi:hypothetical protein
MGMDHMKLSVALWRMPTDPCPAAACFDDGRVVHIEATTVARPTGVKPIILAPSSLQ